MANAHDVAAYVLQERGEMSTWKLQKLIYYAQAWHLAWRDRPLFPEQIEAWANGPVVRDLFRDHRGRFSVLDWPSGNPEALTPDEKVVVDAVLGGYGALDGRQLSIITHSERPWQEAREGLGPTDYCDRAIPLDSMQAYYSALDVATDAEPVDEIDWAS